MMEKVITFSSKIASLLTRVAEQKSFSEEWNDEMNIFLPVLSESFFYYKSQEQLQQAQQLFVNLGHNIADMFNKTQTRYQQNLLKYLSCILVRKEFFLSFNNYMTTLPTEDDYLFPILLSFLQFIHKLLLLVPTAININTTTSRVFACRTLLVASYRFPSFRSTLLEELSNILPSRFHLENRFVNVIEFHTPEKSVCDYFDKLDSNLNSNYELSPMEKSGSRCILSNSFANLNSLHSRKLSSPRMIDPFSEPEDLAIPPPYTLKPISETLMVDENDMNEPSVADKLHFKKKAFHGKKQNSDIIDNENPFSTTTSSSLLKCKSICQGDDESYNKDIRFPFMCLVPFIELSKTVRSKAMKERFTSFEKENPDFYNWGDIACVLGDDFLNDVTFEWMEKFFEPNCLLFQFLSTFISLCQEACNSDLHHIFWEGIPGYFLYLQVFFTMFQYFLIQRSSQYIIRRNGEEKMEFRFYAESCINMFLLNGNLFTSMMTQMFISCKRNILFDIFRSIYILHQMIAYLRTNFINDSYCNPPYSFYEEIYKLPAITCLIEIEKANSNTEESNELKKQLPKRLFHPLPPSKRNLNPKQFIISDIMKVAVDSNPDVSSVSSGSQDPEESQPGLSLEVEEESTCYNIRRQSSSIVFNVNDMDHVVAQKQQMVVSSTNGDVMILQSGNEEPTEPQHAFLSQHSHNGHSLAHLSSVNYESKSQPMNCIQIISHHKHEFFNKRHCFTRFQAIEYWIQKGIVASRGEGSNLISHLISHRIVRFYDYQRRYRETTLQLKPLEEIVVWEQPEYCPFDHQRFIAEFDYSFLFYIFSSLLKHEHTAILEKILVFIYENIDFFTGETRLALFRSVLLPFAPLLFNHWSPNIRQIYHRILVYKMYHTRRCYLPVCNSCEWLVILNSIIEKYYLPSSQQFLPRTNSRHSQRNSINIVNEMDHSPASPPSTTTSHSVKHEEFRRVRKELFRKEKGRIVQQQIVDAYVGASDEMFNERTDIGRRCRRIQQCCEISKKRESQTIDLLLCRYENQFLFEYIGLISQDKNYYSFENCLDTFDKYFVQNANQYVQIQMKKELVYDKSCPKIIPENLYPYYWSAILEYLSVLGVYEMEMDKTHVKRGLLSRLFKKLSDDDLIIKLENPVKDTNSDLEFILSPSYVV